MILYPPTEVFDGEGGNVTKTGTRFKESSDILSTTGFSSL